MLLLALTLIAQAATPASPEPGNEKPQVQQREVTVSADQLLQIATAALMRGDEALAVKALTAMLSDPEVQYRNEARFRLASLAASKRQWVEAGTYLRAILDEEPGAQRARLELARVQAEMGDIDASRRTLREAQAGGLPPEVARLVERFSAALRERKPFGMNVQLAIAPDSNVNRATRSETLGTVIGDFELDEDARQSSGIGASIDLDGYYRLSISENTSLLARAGFSGDFYGSSEFNSMQAILSAGPEFRALGGRATVLAGASRRWFGGRRYYDALEASLQFQRPLDRQSQLRAGATYSRDTYRLNALQDGHSVSGFVGYERSFTPRTGGSVSLGASRHDAADPAYSTTSGQVTATVWHDLGRTTVFSAATYQHLEADERLAIYPDKRVDDYFRLSAGATLRALTWHGWAPQVKVSWERNNSPIEIYDYRRWGGEIGISRAF